jgi:stage II sporulation protein D
MILLPVSRKVTFTIIIAAALFLLTQRSEAVQNFNLKVGVADSVSSGKVIGEGLLFSDAKGLKGNVRNGAAITASGGGISVGGRVLALPVVATAKNGLGWDKVRYRGRLVFIKAGSGFTVVNEIDMENYLRGILKMEMSADWPFEALEAQAILARTYAVKNRGRSSKRGYDFDAGENAQVYRGVNAEDPRTDKAVSQTAGMILTYNGSPADIYYHSDSGGATADISHVWGGSRPYLQIRPEIVNYTSPNSTWQTTLTGTQLTQILSKMGKNVGNVRAFDIAQVDTAGRAVLLRVSGDRGSVDVKAHDFRMAAGSRIIKSTNFVINGAGATVAVAPAGNPAATNAQPAPAAASVVKKPRVDPLIEMTKEGIFTTKEMMEMLMDPSKREEYLKIGYERMKERSPESTPPPEIPAETPKPPQTAQPGPVQTVPAGTFLFSGKGWGHGVGLSQWGAKAMAESGMKCEAILDHYFPGTKIGK